VPFVWATLPEARPAASILVDELDPDLHLPRALGSFSEPDTGATTILRYELHAGSLEGGSYVL
jgi:hypothetical protein